MQSPMGQNNIMHYENAKFQLSPQKILFLPNYKNKIWNFYSII